MGKVERMEWEMETKCSAIDFYEVFKGKAHQMPNACPRLQSIELHEGDWETEGHVKLWSFIADGKLEKNKEKLSVDEANKVVTLELIEGTVFEQFNSFKVIMQAIPKPKGGLIKWAFEYERKDGKLEKNKEKLSVDEANKVVTLELIEGTVFEQFNSFKVIMQAIPKPKGGLIKWAFEYERKDESPHPEKYKDFASHLTETLDDYLVKGA
ncbi:Bet v I/Major latex protein [Dillenia turbinata]|uniref:Bet v I/Major latex protein n=1 Tax=Dillenia turbinata TaxID=194707 RepID=A0AAN8UUR3_9MAGN